MHGYYGNIDILLNGLRDNTCNAFQIIWKLYQPKWILNAADEHTYVDVSMYARALYTFRNFNQPLYHRDKRKFKYYIGLSLGRCVTE